MVVTYTLPRSSAESQGLPSSAILQFVQQVEQHVPELHSLMLLRHGQVVAEGWWQPYGSAIPHMLYSLSKSFTSTAVGLAVSEGRLSVDDPVFSFFPEDAPAEVSANLAAMRVRHLLTMTTGHAEDTTGHLDSTLDGNWAQAFLAQPVVYAPGTHFLYNSGATYMCSAIVQKLTGLRVLDYLTPRLFAPLDIEGATWETCPRGIDTGGWGLSLKTEDIARFGQLYLQKGIWRGQQLLPAAWIAEATARQVPNDLPSVDWRQGYGYQFWRCRHGAYRGDGAFGQYCLVMPAQGAVLAITSGVTDMQAVLDLVWEHLLPAMCPGPLPEEPDAQHELAHKLATLSLRLADGAPTSPLLASVAGREFRFAPNEGGLETLALEAGQDYALVLRDVAGQVYRLPVGVGRWLSTSTTLDLIPHPHNVLAGQAAQLVAASGAWPKPDTLAIKLCCYEAPYCLQARLHFAGRELTVESEFNVSFGPTTNPTLKAQMR